MQKHVFNPKEILFSSTTRCNLRCPHCDIKKYPKSLPIKIAKRFIAACAKIKFKRVGFTGGEPFLDDNFLCAVAKETVKHQLCFSRIMTNGAWFRTKKNLVKTLARLCHAGYDGSFCISVDAFHDQSLHKVATFIHVTRDIWKRPNVVTITSVTGAFEKKTHTRLKKLALLLNARLISLAPGQSVIKNDSLFIRISTIALSPIGKASRLKNPWDGKWFRDDFCKGPGHVFFVLPDATVKPCCGYANDSPELTIGSLKKDSPRRLAANAQKNSFVAKVFSSGLHPLRKTLEKSGISFPGKTTNHCFFCHYLVANVPRKTLLAVLKNSSPRLSPPASRLRQPSLCGQ